MLVPEHALLLPRVKKKQKQLFKQWNSSTENIKLNVVLNQFRSP
jgi:hypothetical protein